jgi:hypothetical protein
LVPRHSFLSPCKAHTADTRHRNFLGKSSAAEQDRPDVGAATYGLEKQQPRLDPKRFVFYRRRLAGAVVVGVLIGLFAAVPPRLCTQARMRA